MRQHWKSCFAPIVSLPTLIASRHCLVIVAVLPATMFPNKLVTKLLKSKGYPKMSAAAVDPNYIKTLLANGLSTFFINSEPIFINGPRSLPRNPPNCIFLEIWVFDSFMLVNKLFAKTLRRYVTFG